MLELSGKRKDAYKAISSHPKEQSICIKIKPSKELFFRLLQQTDVKEIYMTKGIFDTVPQKVRKAVENAGVKIILINKSAGRPPKISDAKKEKVVRMLRKGIPAPKISKKTGVSASSIYAIKRRNLQKGFIHIPDST